MPNSSRIFCSYSPSFSPNRVGIRNSTDYSPFGVELDGRTVSLDGYRFGFNGKEGINEVSEEANTHDFGSRIYCSGICKFISKDKFESRFIFHSPYSTAGNTPICATDENGDSIRLVTKYYNLETKQFETKTFVISNHYLENDKLANYMLIGINEVMKTEIGKQTINQFINNSDVDVYISYFSYNNNTGDRQSGGFTITPDGVEIALGDDCTFDSNRFEPEKNSESDSREKYRVFDGITVTSKENYFVVIHKSNYDDFKYYPEKLFHEFYHVLLFNNGIIDNHHELMGSDTLGVGDDITKPVPLFRHQLSNPK